MDDVLIGTNKFNCNLCKCQDCMHEYDRGYCGGCEQCKEEQRGIIIVCADYISQFKSISEIKIITLKH